MKIIEVVLKTGEMQMVTVNDDQEDSTVTLLRKHPMIESVLPGRIPVTLDELTPYLNAEWEEFQTGLDR